MALCFENVRNIERRRDEALKGVRDELGRPGCVEDLACRERASWDSAEAERRTLTFIRIMPPPKGCSPNGNPSIRDPFLHQNLKN